MKVSCSFSSRNLIVDLTKTPFPRLWRIFHEKIGKFLFLLPIIYLESRKLTRDYTYFYSISSNKMRKDLRKTVK